MPRYSGHIYHSAQFRCMQLGMNSQQAWLHASPAWPHTIVPAIALHALHSLCSKQACLEGVDLRCMYLMHPSSGNIFIVVIIITIIINIIIIIIIIIIIVVFIIIIIILCMHRQQGEALSCGRHTAHGSSLSENPAGASCGRWQNLAKGVCGEVRHAQQAVSSESGCTRHLCGRRFRKYGPQQNVICQGTAAMVTSCFFYLLLLLCFFIFLLAWLAMLGRQICCCWLPWFLPVCGHCMHRFAWLCCRADEWIFKRCLKAAGSTLCCCKSCWHSQCQSQGARGGPISVSTMPPVDNRLHCWTCHS